MPHPIVMPSFGMYTVDGKLVAWLHATGMQVEEGQPLLEIETEKATHEVVAPASGILHTIVHVGAAIKEQDVVGYILAPGEIAPTEDTANPLPSIAATPARQLVRERSFVKATPIARRLAAAHGLDLTTVIGSGPGGRIVEADVQSALQGTPLLERQPKDRRSDERRVSERIPLTGLRGAIAARLRHSADTAVALTLTREVEADAFVAAREQLAAALGRPLSFDAMFVKLMALGLRECPTLNAVVQAGEILRLDEINVGFAVSLARGLVVPVIRNADTLPLGIVNERVSKLTQRARGGTISVGEMDGGTATVTNLGGHGIDAFTPVLNPPESCILGVGRIMPRPVVRDGVLRAGVTCVLSLTFDHRVEDGAPAAQLLEAVARLMNDMAWLVGLADDSTEGAKQ
jgi:pyruvate dehydrogenase E2 component (dihydrolipoamide acetyltransferase)